MGGPKGKLKRTRQEADEIQPKSKNPRLYTPHVADCSTSSDMDEGEGGEVPEDNISGDEDLPIHFRFLDEKTPRERASKTKPKRDTMEVAYVHDIAAHITWDFGLVPPTLSTKHNVHTTEARFHKSLVNYRCIHGVHQERRGEVTRNVDVNYTGAVLALMWP
ncbi:hypothetical protein PHYPSEUDO_006859 [Phytophthora pseudosyringae]|uniref:Uncharacterized protein n=1 Tax=Phytophthora pseudosyringae TaxID=221518 RepID=A0A8T1WEX2_9STRA|nr:hypothetical protein PHYPSEUDO_006859 [Phytophthora pseudosyringae]